MKTSAKAATFFISHRPPAISARPKVPGDPGKSYLMEVLKAGDPDLQMPKGADPLPAAEIALVETWIAEGAPWPGQMSVLQWEKALISPV